MTMTEENSQNKELKTVKKVYAALGVTLLAAFIPSTIAAIAVVLLLTGTLIAAYSIRRKSEPESLTANHMAYIIRSIWISSLVGAIATAIALVYVLSSYDPGPIQNCLNNVMGSPQGVDSCLSDFVATNKTVFIIGTIIAAIPVTGYSLWRLFNGSKAALKSVPVEKPQAWF